MLEVGDEVKVLDPGKLRSNYQGSWASPMEDFIGTIQTIEGKDGCNIGNVKFQGMTWMPEHLQKVEYTKMSDYIWQPGDYVLTEELNWEDYLIIGGIWLSQGVGVGEFPDLTYFNSNAEFGIHPDSSLYHGAYGLFNQILNGRRVQLVGGEIQVVEDADKGINASVVKAVAEDAFNAGYAASLQSERHHQVRYLLKKHGVI